MKNNCTFRNWVQVRVPVNSEIEEPVINFLFEAGSCGCEQLQNAVVAYFADQTSGTVIRSGIETYYKELAQLGFELPDQDIEIETIEDQDWNAIWKKNFKPLVISKKLVVKPTWEKLKASTTASIIEIDPQQAFGTGHHATTCMLLRLLERHLSKDQIVLDVGTGTGILAIAAVKLGADKVVALDKDLIAARTAKENLRKNSAGAKTKLFAGELQALAPSAPSFDVILANLNQSEISKLLPDFARLLKDSGHLFVTGILATDEKQILRRISGQTDLLLREKMVEDGWLGLVLQKGQG